MPFLRFTRDKRGYETTSLVHASRRNGRSVQQVLYWFRTPPGVKVGRPALDEEAIRSIEEQNPDIEFDWPKILEAQPSAPPPSDDARQRRVRRDRDRPRAAKPARSQSMPPAPSSPPSPPASLEREPEREPETAAAQERRPSPEPRPEPEQGPELELDPEREPSDLAQALEQLTHPEAEETIEPAPTPVAQSLGPEQLTRLRARYAELLARIAERAGDPARAEALRAQAVTLNPDAWVTDDEVRQGIEAFEPKIRELRAALGIRRRRRSRRGGRRRRTEGAAEGAPVGDAGPAGEAETEPEPDGEEE